MKMECLNVSGGIGRRIFAVLFLFSFVVSELQAASITLLFDDKSPQAVFASKDIQTALRAKGHSVRQSRLRQLGQVTEGVRIVLSLRSDTDVTRRMLSEGASPPGTLRSEGYSIRTSSKAGRTTHWVVGADAAEFHCRSSGGKIHRYSSHRSDTVQSVEFRRLWPWSGVGRAWTRGCSPRAGRRR